MNPFDNSSKDELIGPGKNEIGATAALFERATATAAMIRHLTRVKGQDMQAYLDMRTLFFVTSTMGLVLFVCMFWVLRTRKTYGGFRYWTGSSLCYFLGNVLIGLRGAVPDFFSILVANTMITCTLMLISHGISIFVNKRDPLWPHLAIIALTPVALAFFTYFSPSIRYRIYIISIIYILSCSYCVFKLRRSIPGFLKKPNSLLEFSFAIAAIWSLGRIVFTFVYDRSIVSMLDPSVILGGSVLGYCAVFVFICFGLCLLNFQRTEYELLNATNEVKQLTGILPMCASCKKIRDDQGYWSQVEAYIRSHSEAVCSHSICPECLQRLYPQYYGQEIAPDSP
jgi:hypothetical protein